MKDVTLLVSDPTIWAKCPKCTKTGRGVVVGNYFAKAYPRRKEDRTAEEVIAGEVCENCGTQMVLMYEVK